MEERKELENTSDILHEKKVTEEDRVKFFQMLISKFHEGISQLSGEAQDIMLKKHNEANIEATLAAMARISGRDPRTFDVDEMIKHHEPIENQYAEGKASLTREGNVIIWKSNLSHCYDPKIQYGMIKPYPAYCKQCNQYFFESLYGIAHKGEVKVEGLNGVLKGDGECATRIELL